jgi:hypothetical protein
MEPESSSPHLQEPATYMPVYLISQRHKFNRKYVCVAHKNCISLTVTCSSEIHTESIVSFPLQQWLHDLQQCYIIRTMSSLFLIFEYLFYTEKGRSGVLKNTDSPPQKYTVSYRKL